MPVETPSAVVVKKVLQKLVDDISNLAKSELRARIKRWRAAKNINTLYKKLRNVRTVKTIWQVEKGIDLTTFYCPTRVELGLKRTQINDVGQFGYPGNFVIQGTVGQGKSIFLRYLASREMIKGNVIPLFVELRRIGDDESLIAHLIEETKSLGLDVDQATLEFLFEHGKVILFLDAFDEIRESRRTELITEIESLAKRYEQLRMLVTSRPDSGVARSPFFRVYEVCPLENDEFEEVIVKAVHDVGSATEIIKGIRKQKDLKNLLTTPLMVALLVVRYRVDRSIPENRAAFFDDLFMLLLQRHDKSKAGYVRPRKSSLTDGKLRDFFNALCFVTRRNQELAFRKSLLHERATEALEIIDCNCEPDNALDDIIRITCMILDESNECRFIHKSVQEFHSACFIKQQLDEGAQRFYDAMTNKSRVWGQELTFLSVIDEYRFKKYFLIPELESIRDSARAGGNDADIIARFGKDVLKFEQRGDQFNATSYHWSAAKWVDTHLLPVELEIHWKNLVTDNIDREPFDKSHDENRGAASIALLLGDRDLGNPLRTMYRKFFQNVDRQLQDAVQFVKHKEEQAALIHF